VSTQPGRRDKVTILPFDIDPELLRSGMAHAAADHIDAELRSLRDMVAELRANGVINRAEWASTFETLMFVRDEMEPVLQFGMCFSDQWPNEGNGSEAENAIDEDDEP
jgi:hypothetical protein